MRRCTLLLALLLIAGLASAQTKWQLEKAYSFGTVLSGSGIHGIAVDLEGKIWVAPFSRTEPVGDGTNTVSLYAMWPDGTPASFSPIKFFVGPTFTDTLKGVGCRGISVDKDGNIVGTWGPTMYRIDSKTGAALNKVVPDAANSAAQPVCDKDNGYIYVGTVLAVGPLRIYNADFTILGNAVDFVPVIVRSYGITTDGKDIYQGDLSTRKCAVYHSDFPGLLSHALTDSLMVGGAPSAFGWQPGTGWLWMDAGNATNEIPLPPWTPFMYYAFDVTTKEVKDSLMIDTVNVTIPSAINCRGRGIAFSASGDTAWICMFNVSENHVQMFVKKPVSVEPVKDAVPVTYRLSQNYPNPFNPSTEIEFAIPASGRTTLVVYDLMGKEVATLVNEELGAGSYKTRFNASKLSSGTYVYMLTSGTTRIVKKMMLIK